VDPEHLVQLPAAELRRELAALQRQWAPIAAATPTPQQCDSFARRYAELADDHGQPIAAGRFNAGVVRDRCDQADRAAAHYQAVIDDRDAPAKIRAAALNNLGIAHVRAGRTEAGEQALHASIEADPLSPAPRTNLAALLRQRSRSSDAAFAAAEHQLQTALALRSDDRAAFENLARLYYERGHDGERSYLMLADLVVTQGLRVLERDGERSAALLNVRGLVFAERGDPTHALRAFDAAVQVDDGHAEAHLNRALLCLRIRDFRTARDSLDVALANSRFADDADAWLAMGVAQRGLRNYAKAEKAFAVALDQGHDLRGLYNLGLLYHEHIAPNADASAREDYDTARRYFDRFTRDAAKRAELGSAVADARRRRGQIDELLVAIDDGDRIAAEVEKLEALQRAQQAETRARLLDLEQRARSARDAQGATPAH
jgi:tetratricopeptide (TPR) repeat protein